MIPSLFYVCCNATGTPQPLVAFLPHPITRRRWHGNLQQATSKPHSSGSTPLSKAATLPIIDHTPDVVVEDYEDLYSSDSCDSLSEQYSSDITKRYLATAN